MRKPEGSSSRRDFLHKMFVLAPTCSMAVFAPLSGVPAAPVETHAPRYFTPEEWAFLRAACARLIPADENGPGAVELGVPEFVDREMDGAFGHAATWYMQGPFAAAPPELGYQAVSSDEVGRLRKILAAQKTAQQRWVVL